MINKNITNSLYTYDFKNVMMTHNSPKFKIIIHKLKFGSMDSRKMSRLKLKHIGRYHKHVCLTCLPSAICRLVCCDKIN